MSQDVGVDTRVCPRCEVEQGVDDFRGRVCGWCAADLERALERATTRTGTTMSDEFDDSAYNKPAVDLPDSTGFRHEVSRPKPTAVWKFPWQYQDLMGRVQPGQIELEAGYAEGDARLGEPDRFELQATHRGRRGAVKLVLSRESAVDLHKALGEALAWDGH